MKLNQSSRRHGLLTQATQPNSADLELNSLQYSLTCLHVWLHILSKASFIPVYLLLLFFMDW